MGIENRYENPDDPEDFHRLLEGIGDTEHSLELIKENRGYINQEQFQDLSKAIHTINSISSSLIEKKRKTESGEK